MMEREREHIKQTSDHLVMISKWLFDDIQITQHIKKENNKTVWLKNISLDTINDLRKQIYWGCSWYPELIEANIPIIKSKILPTDNDYNQLSVILDNHLSDQNFLRFCNASPKDVCVPIFGKNNSIDEIINVFSQSARTHYMFHNMNHNTHLMIRDVTKINYEVRCFWHLNQLRAVSGPLFFVGTTENRIKDQILQFFDQYGPDLPYTSMTIDLGISDDEVFIIEINSFGIDSQASAELFDWELDYDILYHSKTPIFKFYDRFQW